MAKVQFECRHCGRRVFAERGPLTVAQLCRSCLEKARASHAAETKPPDSDRPSRA